MDLKFSPQSPSPQLVTLGSVVHLGKWQHIVINVLPTIMEPLYKVRDNVHFKVHLSQPKKVLQFKLHTHDQLLICITLNTQLTSTIT